MTHELTTISIHWSIMVGPGRGVSFMGDIQSNHAGFGGKTIGMFAGECYCDCAAG